ncbi:ligand-dependent nuclear receptor corepressor-like protein isoform X3 [Gadus morhua]|uniref:Ligand dependent nuclear receptor corepressor-like n=1 Tax=Gadus morhua TaxID=8049 RepID=A0A8C5CNU5_GADMO|nr:ligand-dependent nuclear receptor corepressor-like protein isoform X3 [Gadus morhua]
MAAAQCRSSKCTAERKGFRRELDSWRHKLIHCVGVESILEGIYGPMLLRDLNIFDDCEPKESDDWSVEASCSHCSFCTLPLDQLSDLPPAAASPLHSPSDYSPCQAPTLSESSQSAQQFLQAVFHKKDVPHGYDSNVPLAAQELMKKMIHKFAIEYASKSHVHMTMNGLTTDNLSPQPTPCDLDAPLDLTVPREKEEDGEPGPDAVLDLSKRTSVCSAAPVTADNKSSGRQRRQREDYVDRSWELSEGLLSKALKDVRSGRLQEQRAALLYGIPQRTLRQGLEGWAEERLELLHRLAQQSSEEADPFTPYNLTSSTLGGEACLVLQKVAAWAEKAENEGEAEEHSDYHLPAAFCSGLQKTLSLCFPQLRDTLQPPASPTPSLEAPASLRIPQVRSTSDPRSAAAAAADSTGVPEKQQHHSTSFAASTTNAVNPGTAARALFKLRPPYTQDTFTGAASHSPLRLDLRRSSLDDSEECGDRRDKDKQPRKKRGRYRQYDHDLLEEAITMVMGGRMSVSKAQGVYGVPHSTLEYKVKERSGTLKNPPKKKSPIPCLFNSNSSGSGANARNAVSGTSASAAATKRF